MAAEKQDFKMWKGETKRIIITVTEPDGTPVDLAGASIVWLMQRQVYNETVPRVRKETGDGIEIFGGGVFHVNLEPADTLEIPKGYYLHEAEVTDQNGNVSVVTVGTVDLAPSIT
jgi:hypothetical protein